MAHFFKYGNRPLHKGTKEYEEREKRDERLRQEGLKRDQGPDPLKDAREAMLRRKEEAKMLRKIKKGSAVKKTLDKHQHESSNK